MYKNKGIMYIGKATVYAYISYLENERIYSELGGYKI